MGAEVDSETQPLLGGTDVEAGPELDAPEKGLRPSESVGFLDTQRTGTSGEEERGEKKEDRLLFNYNWYEIWKVHPAFHGEDSKRARRVIRFNDGFCDWEIKRRNEWILFWAVLGIVLMVATLEIGYDVERKQLRESWWTVFLKCLISLSTLFLIVEIVCLYRMKLKLQCAKYLPAYYVPPPQSDKKTKEDKKSPKVGNSKGDKACWDEESPEEQSKVKNYRNMSLFEVPGFLYPLLLEILICFIHPIPFVVRGDSPFVDDKIGLLMFLRAYLLIRCVQDRALIHTLRQKIQRAAFKAGLYPVFDVSLALKYTYQRHVVVSQVSVIGLMLGVLCYSFYVIEREKQDDFSDFRNVAYFTAVTMSTVGYGDFTPKTANGKVLAVAAAVVGICISSLLTAVITTKVTLQHQQLFATKWVERKQIVEKQVDCAARFIQNEVRYRALQKAISVSKAKVKLASTSKSRVAETVTLMRLMLKKKRRNYKAKRVLLLGNLRRLKGKLANLGADNPIYDIAVRLERKMDMLLPMTPQGTGRDISRSGALSARSNPTSARGAPPSTLGEQRLASEIVELRKENAEMKETLSAILNEMREMRKK